MSKLKKLEAAFKQLAELAYTYRQAQEIDYGVSNYEHRRKVHNATVEFDYFFKSMGIDKNTDFKTMQISFHGKKTSSKDSE